MSRYIVSTQDVDGRGRRSYSSRAGAIKRFEEMVGYSFESQVREYLVRINADGSESVPPADAVRFLSAVSPYGTVVRFQDRGPQPKKGKGLEVALAYLRELVAFGVEYPDAEWKALIAYGVDSDKLRALYDEEVAA